MYVKYGRTSSSRRTICTCANAPQHHKYKIRVSKPAGLEFAQAARRELFECDQAQDFFFFKLSKGAFGAALANRGSDAYDGECFASCAEALGAVGSAAVGLAVGLRRTHVAHLWDAAAITLARKTKVGP